MRILVDRVGVSLPFVEVAEAVVVRVLGEDVGVGNREAEFLQPFVRHGRMEESVLQSRGLSSGADDMFFWHEQTGATGHAPLRWGLQVFHRLGNLGRSACGDFVVRWRQSLESAVAVAEARGIQENKKRTENQKKRSRH